MKIATNIRLSSIYENMFVFCVHLDTSKSYVNHSLPDRPDFYRSIHLQKAHLVGESLGTVVFCMVTTSTCFCDTLQ